MNLVMNRQVKTPHSYYRKSKTEYRDWRWAMIRELIQNSYDAGATEIRFWLTGERGMTVLRCDDNGSGMSADILENVLLCMGGSHKLDGSIGGFGYAKSILFFAHQHYVIHTGNHFVQGSGGEYNLGTTAEHKAGTNITVILDDDEYDRLAWHQVVIKYVSTCFMEWMTGRGVDIYLNDALLDQDWSRYEVELENELGSVWYNEVKEGSFSRFIVSVGGLPMFEESIYSDTNESKLVGCIELSGGSKVLTANRDGFGHEVREQMAKLFGHLVQNQSVQRFGQSLEASLNWEAPPEEMIEGRELVESTAAHFTHRKGLEAEEIDQLRSAIAKIEREMYPANFHVKVAALAARGSAKSEAYITASQLIREMNLHRSAKLAKQFKVAVYSVLLCEWALKNGIEAYTKDSRRVTDWDSFDGDIADLVLTFHGKRIDVGFAFIKETEGLCSFAGDNSVRLYINPRCCTEDSTYRLYDLADATFHECSHIWEMHHGERFTIIEACLRKSFRRWMFEYNFVRTIASA